MTRIERGVFPYRIVFFLDHSSAGNMRTSWLNSAKFRINNLRIQGSTDWLPIVSYLAKTVPQIVLDSRIPSPVIVQESQLIVSENLLYKTLVVPQEDGTTPLFDKIVEDKTKQEIRTATPQNIVTELRNRGIKHTYSPNDLPMAAPTAALKISNKVQHTSQVINEFDNAILSSMNYQGPSPIIREAQELLNRLIHGPGVLRELDNDIREIENFVIRWKRVESFQDQAIILAAEKVWQAIGELQIEIDTAPVGVVDEDEARINH